MTRTTKIRTLATAGAGILAAILLGAGSCDSHADAPDPCIRNPSNCAACSHAHVIHMPDGFRNVSFSCYDTTGIYVTSAAASDNQPSSIAVVLNDPHCGR